MFPRLLDREDHPLKGQELLNNLHCIPEDLRVQLCNHFSTACLSCGNGTDKNF